MVAVGSILAFVAMFWLLSFVAALLLCSPVLLEPIPRRHRVRLPTSDEVRAMQQARVRRHVESKPPPAAFWLYLLYPILAPMMIVLFVLVLVPAFAAMWFSAVCMNFRYFRRATYRALRRRRAVLSFFLSYPIGVALFVQKIISPKREVAQQFDRR